MSVFGFDFIRFSISFFLIANIGLYYPEYGLLTLASQVIMVVMAILVSFNKRAISGKNFILTGGFFVLLSFVSCLSSISMDHSIEYFYLLLKSFVLAVFFVMLCDKPEQGKFAIRYFAHSGLIFGLIYISKVGVAGLGYSRAIVEDNFGMPNINVVSLVAGISFIYYFFDCYDRKSKLSVILLILSFFVILLLGSRKSLFFSLLGVLILWFNLKGHQKISFMGFSILSVVIALSLAPDGFFDFAFERFGSAFSFLNSKIGSTDESDLIRVDLLVRGLDFFTSSPLYGYGYAVFPILYAKETGLYISPHNNYLDVVVGVGFLGLISYFIIFFIIIRGVFINAGDKYKRLVLVVVSVLLLNGFLISFMGERYAWVLFSILYAFSVNKKHSVSE